MSSLRIRKEARRLTLLVILLLAGCASWPFGPPTPTNVPIDTDTPSPAPTETPLALVTVVPPTATREPVTLDRTATADLAYVAPAILRHVWPEGAVLSFELSQPQAGRLFVWPGDQLELATWANFDASQARSVVTMTGLTPGESYTAMVGVAEPDGTFRPPMFDGAPWDPITFRTPSLEKTTWRVGILGDTGFGDPVTSRLVEEMNGYDLDLAIHTGDVVYRVEENAGPVDAFARKFYLPFSPLLHNAPLYPVVGNHDQDFETRLNGTPFYYTAFPPIEDPLIGGSAFQGRNEWYAFATGPIQWLMLNTQTFFGQSGGEAQDSWLAERLRDDRFAVSIPVFHVAPYTSGLHTFDGVKVRKAWLPIFREAGVPLVISGHDHNYERLIVDGLTLIVSGGGSAILYDLREPQVGSMVFARRSHFVLLEIGPDAIQITAIGLGGEVLDQTLLPLGDS